MDRNLVVFKGNRDGITVVLDPESSFDELKESFSVKVTDARKFFEGSRMSVDFAGRELDSYEENELIRIITNTSNADISINNKMMLSRDKKAKRKLSAEKTPEPENGNNLIEFEIMTLFHQGSLRSGQSIEYPGSVVIVGDINPGAEVIAGGNISVFGCIKGMVHAGCNGDRSCYITAVKVEPIQLRIADIITYAPQGYFKKNRDRFNPSYAYVRGEEIYIHQLQ